MSIADYMRIAILEAEASLREGNHGFGAVVLQGDRVLARAHDTGETHHDATAHAERKAITIASRKIGKDLSECILVSTHEPCPMCAGAIVWSNMKAIAYGYDTSEALAQGRRRINIPCEEIFKRSMAKIQVQKGVLREECALLYDALVRQEIGRLRQAKRGRLRQYDEELRTKRLQWYQREGPVERLKSNDPLQMGYQLLLAKLGIQEEDAPIVLEDSERLVFHSKNFCPTLEACRILRLDTRKICRLTNEGAMDALLKRMDARLSFRRNYRKLRPYEAYCEEIIAYNDGY
jgi:tRNA(Arg) A34 adenosine deaminase TadA